MYGVIQSAFYCSSLFTFFRDVKRKDALVLFIHHVVAFLLISVTSSIQMHRFGTLVLLLHDVADIFMEAAKISKYARWQKACDILFAIFFVVWCVTRLFILPFFLLRRSASCFLNFCLLFDLVFTFSLFFFSFIFDSKAYFEHFPIVYLITAMFLVLQTTHIFWAYLFAKALHRAIVLKEVSIAFTFSFVTRKFYLSTLNCLLTPA